MGLGGSARVSRLEVKWPSGRVQTWQDLGVDRILEIEEEREQAREFASERRQSGIKSKE